MRLDFSPSHISRTIFISHRHSQRWIFKRTRLVLTERSIWQICCKWTQWDSNSGHLTSYPLSSFHTDAHSPGSSTQQHPWWRSTAFGQCIANKHSETRLLAISYSTYYLHFTQTLIALNLTNNNIGTKGAQHLATALQVNTVRLDLCSRYIAPTNFILRRPLQRWIFNGITLAVKEHSISQRHCKWTEWDSTFFHFISCLLCEFHTDTYNAESCSQQNWRSRSTAFGKCPASEHSETRLVFTLYRTY